MTDEPGVPDPEQIPVVRRVEPVETPPIVTQVSEQFANDLEPSRPKPGFWLCVLLTVAFMAVLIGSLAGAFGLALLGHGFARGFGAVLPGPVPAGEDVKISSLPDAFLDSLALAMPFGYLGCFLFAVAMARVFNGRGWSRMMGLQRLPLQHLSMAVLVLPGFILVSNILGEVLFKRLDFKMPDQGLDAIFQSFHWSFAVLAIGIGPGIVEELWCRGFLGRGLLARFGWVGGIALVSLFFGTMHGWPPPYVLITGIMGVGLHLLYIFSRSLWVPMFVHFANNSLSVLMAVKVLDTSNMDAKIEQNLAVVAILALGNLLFGLFAMWTARGRLVWTDGEPCPAPDDGMIVPPAETGIRIVHSLPNPVWVSFSIVFLGSLVYLLFLR